MNAFSLIIAAATGLGAAACAPHQKKHSSAQEQIIAANWQGILFADVAQGPYVEGWGLFSESGMVNQGQILVFAKEGLASGQVRIVPPSEASVKDVKWVSGKPWEKFLTDIKSATKIKDLQKSFDGVHYEYVHIKRSGLKGAEELERVKMSNPSEYPEAKGHLELIEAFRVMAGINIKKDKMK